MPAEAVMVDDVQSNVDAAKDLGMQGIYYKDFTQFKSDLKLVLKVLARYGSATPTSDQIFHLQEWDPKTTTTARSLTDEVHRIAPELKVLFMGAAALGLPGKNDIDIDILCSVKDIARYAEKLKTALGKPSAASDTMVIWGFRKGGLEIDCILSDPTISHVPRQKRVFELLKADDNLRQEYEGLKRNSAGLPYAEYEQRKKVFFGRLLDEK